MLTLGKNLLDKNSLRNVYFGHVHSHLIYGISAWSSMAHPSQLKEISKIQKQCVHTINQTSTRFDINCQFKDLGIVPFKQLSRIAMCKLRHKVTCKHLPTAITALFEIFGGKKTHRYPTRN